LAAPAWPPSPLDEELPLLPDTPRRGTYMSCKGEGAPEVAAPPPSCLQALIREGARLARLP
jgi:hypothetical protein